MLEIIGGVVLVCMVMLLGISALAAAFEASEKKRENKEDE
jgi:hypothetical protein